MTPAQLKDLFRSDVRDEASPPLWTDTEIFVYMDDAQKMFCRQGGGIADSTSPICTLHVTAGDAYLTYDPRILKLRDLRRMSDGRNVDILNFEDLGHPGWTQDDYGRSMSFGAGGIKFTDRPAPVTAVIVGMDANKLRLLAPAVANDTLQAIVYRMPLEDITASSTAFEIDAQHHRHLLDWMKHLAHEKQDAETYDRGRSMEFRDKFMAYCDQAKAERERREHKYRTVAYGGI
jgi:hypothetical protein